MKIVAALVAVIAIGAVGAALWYLEPWEDEGERAVEVDELDEEFRGSACRRVAGVAARLAETDPTPLVFLRELGRRVAGIRPAPRAFGDLARGGRNRIPGRGFLARFDDGTEGQARHFAGIAAATSFGGAASTRLVSIFVRDDAEDSADGRLTDAGILFANEVLTGRLELAETPRWLLDRLCRRDP